MVDAEDRHDDPENMKKQLPHPTNGSASSNSSQDGAATGSQKEPASQSVSLSLSGGGAAYIPDTQHQVQTLYNRGFDSSTGEWDDYSHYTNPKGLEVASPGVYNDNPSVVFHAGYGYGPHMPYGPYSPVTTPLPSIGGDAQLFSSQQFPYSGQPFYQQLVPPTMPYITSPTQVSQADLTLPMNADQQDQVLFGPSPNYPSPVGSFGRGAFPGNPWTIGFHDQQQGLDGLSSGGLWSGWSKPTDRQRSFPPLSPAVSPQPIGIGSFAQNAGIASEHQRTFSGYGSADPYNRDYLHSGITAGASFGSSSIPGLGMNGQGWVSLDGRRRRWRTGGATCSCNGTPDILIDQNRGPRASKPKTLATSEHSYSIEDNKLSTSAAKMNGGSYNQADFITEYKDARFFVIKSYSEDNVHKSIKYGVWASTPNGNRKLDAAYREAKENKDVCPVFLFFSVNASAQFCGVAEMVGPVDFDTSFDYWQQDRWSGKFPVKWHIIKDVPNSQLRHIVLENNDNKPVTNSRDTQEVKLEQGIEMLNIFKNYDANTSILDDFEFYEGREKVIQEGKARQQASSPVVGPVVKNEQRTPVKLSSDFIDKMSKSFGQVVCFDEYGKEETVADIASSARDNATGSGIDFQVSTA